MFFLPTLEQDTYVEIVQIYVPLVIYHSYYSSVGTQAGSNNASLGYDLRAAAALVNKHAVVRGNSGKTVVQQHSRSTFTFHRPSTLVLHSTRVGRVGLYTKSSCILLVTSNFGPVTVIIAYMPYKVRYR